MATGRVRPGVLALAASLAAAASPRLRGVDDRDLYALAAPRLVGAHAFTSFSVARFANGSASGQELAELGPEALCHCGCWGAEVPLAQPSFALVCPCSRTQVLITLAHPASCFPTPQKRGRKKKRRKLS